jgi:hypothetical protein
MTNFKLFVLTGLLLLGTVASALDRNAFTFTDYKLQVQVEPQQSRLAVRGTVTLHNDSASPQKNAALQISSSLTWRSIRLEEQALQFVSQPYTSDIDHTGELSEAIVSFPKEIPPGGTVELTIGYEGVIALDATRQTRIGVPEQTAIHADWDQIGKTFSAVRGVGHVVWYPVAIDAGNLSEGDSLFEVLGAWKEKSSTWKMQVSLCTDVPRDGQSWTAIMNDVRRGDVLAGSVGGLENSPTVNLCGYFSFAPLSLTVPAFAIGPYEFLNDRGIAVYFSPSHKPNAQTFVQAAQKVEPFVTEWVSALRGVESIVELEDPGAAPFETGSMLLTPLHDTDPKFLQVVMVHELVHSALSSSTYVGGQFPAGLPPWIAEGLAHFLQGVYREHQEGRAAALDFIGSHRAALVEAEKSLTAKNGEDKTTGSGKSENAKVIPEQSLLTTATDELVRSKAAWVWWMLSDMVGEDVLKRALGEYLSGVRNDVSTANAKHSGPDKESNSVKSDSSGSYASSSQTLQHLIEKESKRDLEWFFDDWVYHDRGLPDFRVAAVFTRETAAPTHVTTITVENLGGAAAEVPVTLLFPGGEVRQVELVKGHDKMVLRVETQGRPTEVSVNDGSVPESDMGNNTFKVEAGK